jgi:hypothetical protein
MRLACWLPTHCPSSKLHLTRGIRAAAASLEPSGSTTGSTLQSIGQRRNASLVAYQIEEDGAPSDWGHDKNNAQIHTTNTGKNKICSKSMGWKALAPPVLGWHQLGWANRERSNGRDFYSSACTDLLRGGRWRLKALDAGAGENENDNDPAFLTARRREYPPHTPHRYLVAARVAHRSQRCRSAVRVRSPPLSMSQELD